MEKFEPQSRLSVLKLLRGNSVGRQAGALGELASMFQDGRSFDLWIACAGVSGPILSEARLLQDSGAVAGLITMPRVRMASVQIAQIVPVVRSEYLVVVDDGARILDASILGMLAKFQQESSIPAAGQLCTVHRSEAYRRLLESQPWWRGWQCIPDDRRGSVLAFAPGFYLIRTEVLRRLALPSRELTHLELVMLICDMLHTQGQIPRQFPSDILKCIDVRSDLPGDAGPEGCAPGLDLCYAPGAGHHVQISAVQLRSMLEAAREALKQRHYSRAEELASQALRVAPDNPTALHILGMALHRTGRREHALELVRRSIAMGGDLAEYHNNLGSILISLLRHDEAALAFRRAVELRADYPQALNNLGRCLLDLGLPAEAERHLEAATRLRPEMSEAWGHRAASLHQLSRLEESLECRRRHVACSPNNPIARAHLAMTLCEARLMKECEAEFARALDLAPSDPGLRTNRAMSWLLQGDFDRGWTEYEWRLRANDASPPPPQGIQRWDGEELSGRSLLIRCEQGLGATIQFVRYAQMLVRGGARITIECQPPLQRLLDSLPENPRVIPAGSPLPAADYWIPLLSIPATVRTRLATIPRDVPYLKDEPQRVAHWLKRLTEFPSSRIGITWQGNPRYGGDRLRSVPLQHYAPLSRVPGVTLISLQRGPGQEQLAGVDFPIIDLGPDLDATAPFLDTAAVMMGLDLIITSDTSIAHLAGALGRKVWVALAHTPDWRWMLDTEHCPWYPSMRLFRQQSPGDWPGVFSRMAAALTDQGSPSTAWSCPQSAPQRLEEQRTGPVAHTCTSDRRTTGFGYFNQIYVLNLDNDTHRMSRVSRRLARLGIAYERFAALPPRPGLESRDPHFRHAAYACALSHRAILQQAWVRHLDRVLIFEDDVVLRDDATTWIDLIIPQLECIEWDVFYLGLHLVSAGRRFGANLLEVNQGFHAHAYVVQRRAIPKLLSCIDAVLQRRTGAFDGYGDPTLLKVCATPILAIQEPNHSHTHGMPIDRLSQYFEVFDREDFRKHCAEMADIEGRVL